MQLRSDLNKDTRPTLTILEPAEGWLGLKFPPTLTQCEELLQAVIWDPAQLDILTGRDAPNTQLG